MAAALEQLLGKAKNLARQGELEQASAIYRGILAKFPGNKRARDGLAALSQASTAAIDAALENLRTLYRQGKLAELVQQGQMLEMKFPNSAALCNLVGAANAGLGRREVALSWYRSAIAIDPDFAGAHNNIGNALCALGRHQEALESYKSALAINPDHAEAHNNLGNALQALGDHEAAIASYNRALALKPDYAEAHNNRGVSHHALGEDETAATAYANAIRLRPNYPEAHNNRAILLHDTGRSEEALAACAEAIRLNPAYAEAHHNRGGICNDLQRFEEAIAHCDAALRIDPNHADAQWNKSQALLHLGQFAAGWKLYESRKRKRDPIATRSFPQPQWRGENLSGKTLLLHWEQGLGDTLQFCRFAPLAAAQGAQVFLSVQQSLRRLLEALPGVTIIGESEAPAAFDYHCPLLSLPLALGTTPETIPARPYLQADPAAWRDRLASLSGLKVGLVWAGGGRKDQPHSWRVDRRRSISLAQLAPLATIPGINFVSLQKGPAAAQAATPPGGMILHDWTSELHDFADTAALAAALDLIISVDTSTAHLAGALGKPVWVLSRYDQCWRWPVHRRDSAWSPSARLFQQHQPGEWADVIAKLRQELSQESTSFS